MVPIPLPSDVAIRLGIAGWPLVVVLILGAVQRTGPLVWTLPHSANLTLRQLGVLLVLAGVGTCSGYAFVATLRDRSRLSLVLVGGFISVAVSIGLPWISYRLFHTPLSVVIGMLPGLHTQPAVLGVAREQTDNQAPNVGYAVVHPVIARQDRAGARAADRARCLTPRGLYEANLYRTLLSVHAPEAGARLQWIDDRYTRHMRPAP